MRYVVMMLVMTCCSITLTANDSLRVMHYNLLDYGNMFSDCNAQSNNSQQKDTSFQTIIEFVQPHIVTANEIVAGSFFDVRMMDSVFSKVAPSVYAKAPYDNASNAGFVNMLYYDSTRLFLRKHAAVATSSRDLDLYELGYPVQNCNGADTLIFSVAVIHLPAGGSGAASQTSTLINALDTFATSAHYMVAGDYNLNSSSSNAFQNLVNTSAGKPELNDPIQQLGNWGNNASFADYHTQSAQTSSTSSNCAATGGLDDRYDLILLSDSLLSSSSVMHYIPNTYEAIGQDGNRYQQAINQPSNNSVPTAVAQALQNASDHLPVTLTLSIEQQQGNLSANISGPANICSNDTATLTVSGGQSYTWSTGETGNTITIAPSATSEYKVTAIAGGGAGCQAVDSITVTVGQYDQTTIDTSVCEGQSYVMDGQPFTQSGTYIDTITTPNACDSLVITNLAIDSLPAVTTSNNDTICQGASTTVVASGGASYSWSNGVNNATQQVSPSNTTQYTVTVTDTNGCSATDSVNVTVQQQTQSSVDTTICEGQTYQVAGQTYSQEGTYYDTIASSGLCDTILISNLTVDSLPPALPYFADSIIASMIQADPSYNAYQWSTGDTGQSLSVSSAGTYSVTTTTTNGCTAMDSIYVDIPTGIETMTTTNDVNIWPNPADEVLHIRMSKAFDHATLHLYNIQGQLLKSTVLKGSSGQLAISERQPGLYFLEVAANNRRHVKRVVVE